MSGNLLEEYRFATEDSGHVASRLHSLHVNYLTFDTFLLGAIGILPKLFDVGQATLADALFMVGFMLVSMLGFFVSLGWQRQSARYQKILTDRFTFLQSLEERDDFPFDTHLYSRDAKIGVNPLTGTGRKIRITESLPFIFSVLFALNVIDFAVLAVITELHLSGYGILLGLPGF